MDEELKNLKNTLKNVEKNKHSTYNDLDAKRKKLRTEEARVSAALEDLAKFRTVEIGRHIEELENEAISENQVMHDCFAQAEESRSTDHISEATRYTDEAMEHKFRREDIRTEIGRLRRALVLTSRTHGIFVPWADEPVPDFASPEYRKYDERYREEYKTFLKTRDDITVLERKYSDLLDLEKKLKAKCFKIDARLKKEHDERLNAMIDDALLSYGLVREQCKIVIEENDVVQVYFGGFLKKDGFGHGHLTIKDGNVTYHRAAFGKHGPHNFTDGRGSKDEDIK